MMDNWDLDTKFAALRFLVSLVVFIVVSMIYFSIRRTEKRLEREKRERGFDDTPPSA